MITTQPAPAARLPRLNWHLIAGWGVIQVGALAAPLAFSWSGLAICLVLYFAAGFGVTLGYHRLLTHRSFRTPRVVEYLLTALGALSCQGGPLRWAATHRLHHRHSDEDGDPHSPQHSFWWAHLGWWMPHDPAADDQDDYRRYTPDLARDPVHRAFQRWHFGLCLALAAALYGAGQAWGGLGLSWLLWGFCVRTVVLHHATWLVNSAGHRWGYRSHSTHDRSTNLWWVALISLGEGWHNNHHAFPRSARHGLRWWEVDCTYWLVRLLGLLGLAWDIKLPKSHPPTEPPSPPGPAGPEAVSAGC